MLGININGVFIVVRGAGGCSPAPGVLRARTAHPAARRRRTPAHHSYYRSCTLTYLLISGVFIYIEI